MRDKQRLRDIILNYYEKPFNELFVAEINHSIRLKTINQRRVEVGKTKLGGVPDLPKSIEWPLNKKGTKHYTFLAQINLQEISTYDIDKQLPNEGLLYFFHDWEEWNDGYVLYSKDISNIERVTAPKELTIERKTLFQRIFNLKGIKFLLPECEIDVYDEYHPISQESLQFERLIRTEKIDNIPNVVMKEDVYEYDMLFDMGENEMTPNHHLLGIYNGIHNEYLQLELLKKRIRINKLSLDQIEGALQWKLLFQMDSDGNLNFMIGDAGKIYFFIHEDDLKVGDFSKVKIIGDTY